MQSRDFSGFAEPQPSLAIYVAKLQKNIEKTKRFLDYFLIKSPPVVIPLSVNLLHASGANIKASFEGAFLVKMELYGNGRFNLFLQSIFDVCIDGNAGL